MQVPSTLSPIWLTRGESTFKLIGSRRHHVVLVCAVAFLLFAGILWTQVTDASQLLFERTQKAIHQAEKPAQPQYFDWRTRSQFRPVRQPTKDKSLEDLCKAFPRHLLRDIQPVLKTGHALLGTRVATQLQSVSACLDNALLIFSDLDEDFDGYQVIDVVSDLRTEFVHANEQLRDYVTQKGLAENGTLSSSTSAQGKGWSTDKFKFLPQVSRAWRMRPEKRWYVFYEDNTYLVWDNVFRLLANFDPDKPWYFGSPSPGANSEGRGLWMANGGPGYILSREAVRRLAKDDFDSDGIFTGSKLSQRWEEQMMVDCCGDSILGLALFVDAQTTISGIWPMMQPHPLHGVPLSDDYWCQPVISMHKTRAEDMLGLRRWEESRRESRRPLLYADLVQYLNLTTVAVREDWINSDWVGYPAPPGSAAHTSFEACGQACKEDQHCFGWTHHLRSCEFSPFIRLGQTQAPGIEEWRSDEEKAGPWSDYEKRYRAGWDLKGIKKWMSERERDCKTVRWVTPSLERIF